MTVAAHAHAAMTFLPCRARGGGGDARVAGLNTAGRAWKAGSSGATSCRPRRTRPEPGQGSANEERGAEDN
jgi:hypothetical protein